MQSPCTFFASFVFDAAGTMRARLLRAELFRMFGYPLHGFNSFYRKTIQVSYRGEYDG